MTLKDLSNRFKQFQREVTEERPQRTLEAAFDLLALVKLRIQTSGLNSDSQPFESYTTPYSQTRQEKGLQTGHVDFTDTGNLFQDIKPRITSNDLISTTVSIRPDRQINKDKLAGFFEKRGNIFCLLYTSDAADE